MPSALSADLRERVVAAIEAGASRREAARRFAVSPANAVSWHEAFVREGRTRAKLMGGDQRSYAQLRDAPGFLFAARGMRFGGQAEPGSVVSRSVEVTDVRRRRCDDLRREHTDAWDRHQTLARLVLRVGRFDLTRELLDPRVDVDQLLEEEADRQSGRFRQLMYFRSQPVDVLRPLRCDDAELHHVGADRIADLRALAD